MTSHTFSRLLITFELPPAALKKLEATFQKVYYHPEAAESRPPKEALDNADVWFLRWSGVPKGVTLADTPKLRLIQLTSAGANVALKAPYFSDPKWSEQLSLSSASGIHVLAIPQWIIGQIVNLYMNIHNQHFILRSERAWPARARLGLHPGAPNAPLDFLPLRGKTAGLLGYGHIARETARLLKAFGVEVIAANTRGEQSKDEGYIIPGTGDPDGSTPSAYYSTTDPKSFDEFLSRSEILIASLPSTPQTTYLLKKEHLFKLPKGAIFLNVGRGDLVSSDDLLAALGPSYTVLEQTADSHPNGKNDATGEKNGEAVTSEGHLLGAGLDVTDPEPLPAGHPLFTHPRALITPHTSGNFVGYIEAAADLLIANVEHVRKGGKAYNLVDPKKGY